MLTPTIFYFVTSSSDVNKQIGCGWVGGYLIVSVRD